MRVSSSASRNALTRRDESAIVPTSPKRLAASRRVWALASTRDRTACSRLNPAACTVRPARNRIGSKADNSTFTLSAIGDGFMIARPSLLYSKRERTRSAGQSPWAGVEDELPELGFDGTVAFDSVI